MCDIPLTPFMYRKTQLFQSASWLQISVCSCELDGWTNWKHVADEFLNLKDIWLWFDGTNHKMRPLTLPKKWILFAYYTTDSSNWMVYNQPALLNCNFFLNFSPKGHYIIIFFSTSNNYNFPLTSPAPFPLPTAPPPCQKIYFWQGLDPNVCNLKLNLLKDFKNDFPNGVTVHWVIACWSLNKSDRYMTMRNNSHKLNNGQMLPHSRTGITNIWSVFHHDTYLAFYKLVPEYAIKVQYSKNFSFLSYLLWSQHFMKPPGFCFIFLWTSFSSVEKLFVRYKERQDVSSLIAVDLVARHISS